MREETKKFNSYWYFNSLEVACYFNYKMFLYNGTVDNRLLRFASLSQSQIIYIAVMENLAHIVTYVSSKLSNLETLLNY